MTDQAEEKIHITQETVARQEDLVRRVADARAALKMSAETFRQEWLGWAAESQKVLEEMRQMRMAMTSEGVQAAKALQQFKDVRQFFLDDAHELEVKRLAEFVDLCERLQALQQSGFLDQVADTILKLTP